MFMCYNVFVGVRGQLSGILSLLPSCWFWDSTQVDSLENKFPYLLSHLISPKPKDSLETAEEKQREKRDSIWLISPQEECTVWSGRGAAKRRMCQKSSLQWVEVNKQPVKVKTLCDCEVLRASETAASVLLPIKLGNTTEEVRKIERARKQVRDYAGSGVS